MQVWQTVSGIAVMSEEPGATRAWLCYYTADVWIYNAGVFHNLESKHIDCRYQHCPDFRGSDIDSGNLELGSFNYGLLKPRLWAEYRITFLWPRCSFINSKRAITVKHTTKTFQPVWERQQHWLPRTILWVLITLCFLCEGSEHTGVAGANEVNINQVPQSLSGIEDKF